MMGLSDRLRQTRLLAVVPAGPGDDWAKALAGLPPSCGAVVMTPSRGWAGGLGAELAAMPTTKRLLGLDVSDADGAPDGRALAEAVQPDFVIETAPTPGWPHQWALHGLWCAGPSGGGLGLGAALANGAADFCLIADAGAVSQAVSLAPPGVAASKPWFAAVGSVQEAREAIAAGATRLAWHWAARSGLLGLRRHPDRDMLKASNLLADAWRRLHPDAALGWRAAGSRPA